MTTSVPVSKRRAACLLLWLALFALAVALRWGYAAQLPPSAPLASVDAQGYHALALNLLDGHGFTLNTAPPFVPDAIRTPLYPAFVAAVYALTGRVAAHVTFAQALLDALTALVIVALLLRLTRGSRWAWAAGVLYALNPTAWRFSNELLTEITLAAVIAWLAYAFVRYSEGRRAGWLALAASLSAVSLLIKPNVVLLPALLALAVVVLLPQPASPPGPLSQRQIPKASAGRGGVIVHCLLVLAIAGALTFPWLVRNRVVFGRWLFSHAFDNNLARVSAVATLARVQGERVAPWTPRWEALYSGLLLHAEDRFPDFAGLPRTPREADRTQRQLAAVAGDVLRAHPLAFAVAHLGGFARGWVPQEHRFWYGRLAGRSWDSLGGEEGVFGQALARLWANGPGAALGYVWQARIAGLPPLALALWSGWLLAYAVSALLLIRGTWRWRRRPALLLLCWGAILYATFLPGPISEIRFRVPVVPLLTVLMALGCARPLPPEADSRSTPA